MPRERTIQIFNRFNELLEAIGPGGNYEKAVRAALAMMERVAALEDMVERLNPENSGPAKSNGIGDVPEMPTKTRQTLDVGIEALHDASYTIGAMMMHVPIAEKRLHEKAYRTAMLLDKAIQELIAIRDGIETNLGVMPELQGRDHERDRTDALREDDQGPRRPRRVAQTDP